MYFINTKSKKLDLEDTKYKYKRAQQKMKTTVFFQKSIPDEFRSVMCENNGK